MGNLFPPVIDSTLPAFDEDLNVKFEFSIANSRTEIKHVQMIIKTLTNKSILSQTINDRFLYPQNIYFALNDEIIKNSDGTYSIIIPKEIFEQDGIKNNYYKIQLRFGKQIFSTNDKSSDVFFNEALNYLNDTTTLKTFSEWSTVCLIKPINAPSFGLSDFIDVSEDSDAINTITSSGYTFNGTFEPYPTTNTNALSVLSKFRIKIYDEGNSHLYEDSGYIELENGNQKIKYTSNLFFENKRKYSIVLYIETKDGFKSEKNYNAAGLYNVIASSTLKVVEDTDNAANVINIKGKMLKFEVKDGTNLIYQRLYPVKKDSFEGEGLPEEVSTTHITIDGTIKQNTIEFLAEKGKWTIEFRAFGFHPYDNEIEAFANGNEYFLLEQEYGSEISNLGQKIKISAVNYTYGEAYSGNALGKVNCFVLRKELYDYSDYENPVLIYGENYLVTPITKDKVETNLDINEMTEYYFYIKENQGMLYLYVEETKENIADYREILTVD